MEWLHSARWLLLVLLALVTGLLLIAARSEP